VADNASSNNEAPLEHLIEEGLFRLDETGTPRLRGSKCPGCAAVFGGRRSVCLACFRVGMEDTDLSADGEVYSFTTVHQQSVDALIQPPYTVVQVRLPEGVIVTAPLLGTDPQAVSVGLPVRTKAFRFNEVSGDVVVSYAFVAA
jgi:hypothetical protein